jgi:superfamily II DNA or RNA helicase
LAEFNPVMFTGSESPRKKEKAKEAFIRGDTNLFIMSLRSGAGLDGLQARCTTVVIGELDWSPKIMEQFIGRVNRPPRKGNEITAVYLFANGGSDPIVMDVCGVKATQAQGIVTPLQGIRTVTTDESRIRSLAQQFLASRKIAA